MKFKGNEIMLEWERNGDNYFITYSQWDLGDRYKLYCNKMFMASFDNLTNAKRYCGLN